MQQILPPWNTDPAERFHQRMAIFGPADGLKLIRRTPGKDSLRLRLRRKVAAWDDEFLASLIAA
jgi:hypothetical protein